jgi:chitodextrinase
VSLRKAGLAATMLVIALTLASASAASAVGPDRTPPTRPTNLRITASTATSVSLAWNASTDNSTNWWYLVNGAFRVNPPQTTFTRPLLWPNTTYAFTVIAIDQAGNRSPGSNSVSFTTPPDTTPPTAPVLSTTLVRPNWIGLTWTRSTDNISQVWTTLLMDGVNTDIVGFIGVQSNFVLDLQPSSTHTFQVKVGDAFGNTNQSNVVTVTTPPVTDTVPPTAPTNLYAFDGGCPEAWMSWSASTDNVDAMILYEVYRDGVLDSRATGTSTVTYVDPGVHTFVLKAVDGSGNRSGPSNAFTVQIC